MTTPDQIRSLYVETLARTEFEEHFRGELKLGQVSAWNEQGNLMRSPYLRFGQRMADALAAAGLLPISADYRWVYEPDGTPQGYRERQFRSVWQDAALRCSGCGVTERECGAKLAGAQITAHWSKLAEAARQMAEFHCCPDCRHPWREVSE